MVIQHNLAGLNSKRNQKINESKMRKNLERLSSGYRINRSGDDAAGLAISEKMRYLINGSKQALDNIGDGINLIQTAEGAMQEIHSMLNRMYESCIKASNGVYDEESRAHIQAEVDEMLDEIERITDSTAFYKIPLLKGTEQAEVEIVTENGLPDWVTSDVDLDGGQLTGKHTTTKSYTAQDGSKKNYQMEHAAAVLDFSAFGSSGNDIASLEGKGFYTTCFTCDKHYSIRFTTDGTTGVERSGSHYIYNVDVSGVTDANSLVKTIVDQVDSGNPQDHFTWYEQNGAKLIVYDNRNAGSNPVDLVKWDEWGDPTWVSWTYTDVNANNPVYSERGKFGSGIAIKPSSEGYDLQFQIGPNQEEILEIDLPNTTIGSGALDIGGLSVATLDEAHDSIPRVKAAIQYLSAERGRMGTYQNRLEYTERSIAVTNENLTAAESRIRDTDMAEEITSYTKDNIMLQASMSILTQANALPQSVMNLLQ